MTYKQIEASREIRLWIAQIIVPATVLVAASPELRNFITAKALKVKEDIRNKFQK